MNTTGLSESGTAAAIDRAEATEREAKSGARSGGGPDPDGIGLMEPTGVVTDTFAEGCYHQFGLCCGRLVEPRR